jgi:hypothetical protein
VVDIVDGVGVDVRTGDGVFRMTRVQPAGRPPRWADQYARNEALSPGERLGHEFAPQEWLYTGLRRLLEPDSFDTNLGVGETGTLELVALAGSPHELTVRVSTDSEVLHNQSVGVKHEFRETVTYAFADSGTHTISVEFRQEGDIVDTRYLKVFVHE